MIGIINWLKGYVRIRVMGDSAERFFNLCSHKNILLWDIVRCDNNYELNITVKAFKTLRPIVHKTKVKVVIRQRMGLPFFIDNINRRKVFLIGAMFAVFIWQISGNFLWRIQINGNLYISDEQILDFLKENHISMGMYKGRLEIEVLEKEMRIRFPQIKWISGKVEGTTLCIDMKESESLEQFMIYEDGLRYDMVSPADGTIESIIVRKGIPKVKQGDPVTTDMVLVEGIIPIMNDDGTLREEKFVKSDADIYIRYQMQYHETIDEKHVRKEYTGREKTIPYIRIGEKELTIGSKPRYLVSDVVIQENTSGFINELSMPIKWGNITYREYLNKEYKYNKEEAAEILTQKFIKFVDTLNEKGVQIIEKDVKIKKDEGIWTMSGNLTLLEPVSTWVSYDKENSENNGEIE